MAASLTGKGGAMDARIKSGHDVEMMCVGG
jgi:hypothetical protein